MKYNKLYDIHKLIENNKYLEAEKELLKEKDKLIRYKKSYYSLLVKTKLKLGKLDEVYNLLKKNKLSKMDHIRFIEFSKNKSKSEEILELCLKNSRLNYEEIDYIISKEKINNIFRRLDGYHVLTSYEGKYNNYKNLKIYDFKTKNINKIIKIIENKIDNKKSVIKLQKMLKNNNVDVIIDLGNIFHRLKNTNKFKDKSSKYKYLFDYFVNIKKNYGLPLLISGRKYFKNIDNDDVNNKIKNNINNLIENNIFYTPYKINDDLFILLASLKTGKKIITRDKFRDHLNLFCKTENLYDNFKIYLEQNTFDHYIISKKAKKKYIVNKCIQVFKDYILIPSKNEKYYKIDLINDKDNYKDNYKDEYIIKIIYTVLFIIFVLFFFNLFHI